MIKKEKYGLQTYATYRSIIHEGSMPSTIRNWWDAPYRNAIHGKKMIGFGTDDARYESGYYMYVNRELLKCIVCYSEKMDNPRSDPMVSSDCGYKPI